MTCDIAARIGCRDAGLSAEHWNHRLIQVGITDPLAAIEEEEMYQLSGLGVESSQLNWTLLLPCQDRVAHKPIHWFGKGGLRFVHWHVQQAHSVFGQLLLAIGCD